MINSFDFFKNVPNKKFRIALCISGESRNAMYSFPYIYETFIRSNDIFETDVYIHTRSTYRALHLYEAKKYVIDRSFEGQIFADTFSQEKLSTFPKELRQEFESIPTDHLLLYMPYLFVILLLLNFLYIMRKILMAVHTQNYHNQLHPNYLMIY